MSPSLVASVLLLALALSVGPPTAEASDASASAQAEVKGLIDARDGNTYETVKIGHQEWMAENLAYLPNVGPCSSGSEGRPRYSVYGYQGTSVAEAKTTENYRKYGVLYDWKAATTACAPGWHLPSDAEWEELAQYVSNENGGYEKGDHFWRGVGGHLKAKTGWSRGPLYIKNEATIDPNGTDDYGFSALPGGVCGLLHGYFAIGEIAIFWSSTEHDADSALDRSLACYDAKSGFGPYSKKGMMSVRCVKD
jgi:uncharacterized protein (TIGR02145 family)